MTRDAKHWIAVFALPVCIVGIVTDDAAGATGAWSTPVRLGPNVNGIGTNHSPFVTADGTKLYLSAANGGNEDLYVCEWDSLAEEWAQRTKLGPQINTAERELSPCQSPDGRYLWFIRYTPSQSWDLFYATWDSLSGDWGTAQNAGPQFNTRCIEWSVSISPDGKRMFLDQGRRPNFVGCDTYVMWVSYWNDSSQWWDSLLYMGDYFDRSVRSASMGSDTSLIYFSSGSNYPGVPKVGTNEDIFVLKNNPPDWDSVDNLWMPVNSYERETDVAITADGTYLYFSSTRDTLKLFPDVYASKWLRTSVHDEDTRPAAYTVSRPSPNPFNASTSFFVTLPRAANVEVGVYDLLGRLVRQLLSARLPAGAHQIRWDDHSSGSGVYFIRVKAFDKFQTQKVLLLK